MDFHSHEATTEHRIFKNKGNVVTQSLSDSGIIGAKGHHARSILITLIRIVCQWTAISTVYSSDPCTPDLIRFYLCYVTCEICLDIYFYFKLVMPFIDIAFQADVSRYEDSDFEDYARRNCGELPATRAAAVAEVKRLLDVKRECRPRRMDDAYLLRFLRCRGFIPALAHRLMVRYEDFRSKNPHLYDCDAFGLQRVKGVFTCTFPDNPDNGRITIMRLGKWNMDSTPADDLIRCALLLDEICAMQPRLQILGVTVIIDLQGLSLRHVRHMNLKIANQFVSLLGAAFPLLLRGLHVINYNWIFNTILPMFKQFIPQAGWERIHFHGSNLESLHKFIQPQYLPPEYGGHCKYVVTCEDWLSKIQKYKDDYMVQDLRDLGYHVD